MRHRGILQSEAVQRGDAALWMSIVANSAVVRPVVYGSALAIAAAAFSGVGPGYSGFTRRFGRAAAVAAGAMVAYGAGVAVLDEVGGWVGPALGLAWGVLVAAVLVVVLRTRLHLGILEAALESVQGRPSRHEVVAGANCGECEMNLAPLALFCNACGTSVRAVAKPRQHANVGGAMTGGPR
jgi:hypothetical protein